MLDEVRKAKFLVIQIRQNKKTIVDVVPRKWVREIESDEGNSCIGVAHYPKRNFPTLRRDDTIEIEHFDGGFELLSCRIKWYANTFQEAENMADLMAGK